MDSELGFFCLLVKQGSLVATAQELNLTPPAVSRRLSALEDRLGVRLLNRTTRRISLTNEGEVYFANAQRILSDIDDMERLVSSSRAAPKGLLRVNAPLGFGRSYIGPAISAFSQHFPEVEDNCILQTGLLACPTTASTSPYDSVKCQTRGSSPKGSPLIAAF
jgi:LysR family transcriptional regulator, transcriptional activator for dmlA